MTKYKFQFPQVGSGLLIIIILKPVKPDISIPHNANISRIKFPSQVAMLSYNTFLMLYLIGSDYRQIYVYSHFSIAAGYEFFICASW